MRAYPDGTHPLVDTGREGPAWLEWCAALYESYAADCEWVDAYPVRGTGEGTPSFRYAQAAENLASEIESDIYSGHLV